LLVAARPAYRFVRSWIPSSLTAAYLQQPPALFVTRTWPIAVHVSSLPAQPHMDERQPIPGAALPLFNREGLKSERRIQQQPGNVAVEARNPYLLRAVPSLGQVDHVVDKKPADSLPPSSRRDNHIANGTMTSRFHLVKIGETYHRPCLFHDGRIGSVCDGLAQLQRRQRKIGPWVKKEQLLLALRKAANNGKVVLFYRTSYKHRFSPPSASAD
jgi:hypothetical protein